MNVGCDDADWSTMSSSRSRRQRCGSWAAVRATASTRATWRRRGRRETFTAGGTDVSGARAQDVRATPTPPGGMRRRSTATTTRRAHRVKRDPGDPREAAAGAGRRAPQGPRLSAGVRAGRSHQSAVGGPGSGRVSGQLDRRHELLHNLFAREHNAFVDEFRQQAARTPDADSGLRNPANPKKRHPLQRSDRRRAVRSGAAGGCGRDCQDPHHRVDAAAALQRAALQRHERQLERPAGRTATPSCRRRCSDVVVQNSARSKDVEKSDAMVFGVRLGSGHFRDGQPRSATTISPMPNSLNGGVNHFGSPFNFPEEFMTVYRLHALVPDLLEYRELRKDPNEIARKVPVVETFRGKATDAMHPTRTRRLGAQHGPAAPGHC